MDGFDRIYDLHRLLKGRKVAMPLIDILAQMECSRATFNRIKRHMTDYLGAPIEYSREQGGYLYREGRDQGYELPGLWLKEAELHALLLIQTLIKSLGAGILSKELYPIEQRITVLLGKNAIDPGRLQHRIRILGVATREVSPGLFQQVSEALLRKQCLSLQYFARSTVSVTMRVVSPQRIIHYRNNWYVDAWCHKRRDFRTFALECIRGCSPATDSYKEISVAMLDAHFQGSYGLFSAKNIETAKLLVYPPMADRVASEQWHPQQQGRYLENGVYELAFPFNREQTQELVADILKRGEHIRVFSPLSLVAEVKQTLQASLAMYSEVP